MRPNLDSLTEEILQYLESEHFIVFRARERMTDESRVVEWDTDRTPDFRPYLDCALKLGVRLLHFHAKEFHSGFREEAKQQLEETDLPRERKRDIERRIEELTLYEGFICAIEMSFDFEERSYCFDIETEWFEEWQDILDEIEDAMPEDDGPDATGYNLYSNN